MTTLESIKEYLQMLNPAELKKNLKEISTQDLIENWDDLSEDEEKIIFRNLPLDMKIDLMDSLSAKDQEDIIRGLTDGGISGIKQLLKEMEPDDLVDIIQSASPDVRKSVWENLSDDVKKEMIFLLKFDEDDAAGLMTPRYIAIKSNITVGQALKFIRGQHAKDVETLYIVYVVDQLKRLIGLVSLRDLLEHEDDEIIKDIMETDIISVHDDTDQEETAKIFITYGFLAVPVVDENNVLLGIVTYDDIIDVIREEQTEDVYKMGAMTGEIEPYLETSIWGMVKKRVPWLVILLFLGTITTNVLAHYESIVMGAAFLFIFMPVITQTGGNVSNQSSALMIRGLATGEIEGEDMWRILLKEMVIGLLMGLITGAAIFFRGVLFPPEITIFQGVAIAVSLCFVVVFSTVLGAFAPLLIHKMGFDPTVMSGPLLATFIDVCGLSIYFEITKIILQKF
ncbi:MAG: magnesium transporter [Spirochaetia bacterium]|nr:magnesium transporter [Spirochaetales bacterium]MBR4797248.1 magnesium transporter [Spirochaetia bacterium]MBR5916221.1 magnesium transporter [Spirochaetia bacterium]MBR5927169.1 magnesium transporter [Spirochaetia bacterium]